MNAFQAADAKVLALFFCVVVVKTTCPLWLFQGANGGLDHLLVAIISCFIPPKPYKAPLLLLLPWRVLLSID
uniref:Putative secreted protein n=1 Tax=Anopheles darlingi TaxID=43151 RepID=A0A2M4DMF1_ANODA